MKSLLYAFQVRTEQELFNHIMNAAGKVRETFPYKVMSYLAASDKMEDTLKTKSINWMTVLQN